MGEPKLKRDRCAETKTVRAPGPRAPSRKPRLPKGNAARQRRAALQRRVRCPSRPLAPRSRRRSWTTSVGRMSLRSRSRRFRARCVERRNASRRGIRLGGVRARPLGDVLGRFRQRRRRDLRGRRVPERPRGRRPRVPAGKAPSHPGAFATTGDPSAPEEKRQGVHSATRNAPPRAATSSRRGARAHRGGNARGARAVPTRGYRPRARRPIPGARAPSSPRVFRWGGVRPPDRRDAAAETGKTTGEVETEEERTPRGRPSRGGSPRWSRARAAVSARREAVAAMSPAARAQRRFENDPAPIAAGAL